MPYNEYKRVDGEFWVDGEYAVWPTLTLTVPLIVSSEWRMKAWSAASDLDRNPVVWP